MHEKEKFHLKKTVKFLEHIKGRHTELVTVYIPRGYAINEVVNQLRSEQSTAENIKSKQVRKNVTTALDKIIRHLQLYKGTPDNGLAIFCGNISESEGAPDIELYAIEPSEPIKVRLYWCDQRFDLEPLRDMVAEREIYGLVSMDKSEADIALLVGKKINNIAHFDSIVPGKTRAGGQCLEENVMVSLANGKKKKIKYLKETDKILSYDFKTKKLVSAKIEKIMKRKSSVFFEIHTNNAKINATAEHLFFVSNSKTKHVGALSVGDNLFILNSSEIIKEKLIKINKSESNGTGYFFDISIPKYRNFLANGILVHNSSARFARVREGLTNDWYKHVAEAMNKTFTEHPETIGIIIGGPGPTKEEFLRGDFLHADVKKKILGTVDTSYTGDYGLQEALERGEDMIVESEVVKEKNLLQKFFTELQKPAGMVVYGLNETLKALNMGAIDTVIVSEKAEYNIDGREIIDALEEMVKNYRTKLILVSTDTREGEQFLALGGIGGFLRYRIE